MWLGGKRCTVCRAGAKGGETQNTVVEEEGLVEYPKLSRFLEMLCHGGGTWRKSANVTGQNSAGDEEQTVATCEEVSGCLVARNVETLTALRTLWWQRQYVKQ